MMVKMYRGSYVNLDSLLDNILVFDDVEENDLLELLLSNTTTLKDLQKSVSKLLAYIPEAIKESDSQIDEFLTPTEIEKAKVCSRVSLYNWDKNKDVFFVGNKISKNKFMKYLSLHKPKLLDDFKVMFP